MTIKYSDGRNVEAVLLARTENTLRVAVEGADDTLEFTNLRGTWVSADCEPVSIQFAWEGHASKPKVSEADCYCSRDLAARLIHMLITGGGNESKEQEAPVEPQSSFTAGSGLVV